MFFSIQILRSFALCIAACTLGSTASAIAAPHTIQTFEAPGAGKNGATQQGTLGLVINDFGIIAGITRDANDVRHGFLR